MANWSDVEKAEKHLEKVDTPTLRRFLHVEAPASQNPAFHARFSQVMKRIERIVAMRESARGQKTEDARHYQAMFWTRTNAIFAGLAVLVAVVAIRIPYNLMTDHAPKNDNATATSTPSPTTTLGPRRIKQPTPTPTPATVFSETFEQPKSPLEFEGGVVVGDPKNPQNHVLRFKQPGGFLFPELLLSRAGRYRVRLRILIPKPETGDREQWFLRVRFYDEKYNSIVSEILGRYSPDWQQIDTVLEVPEGQRYRYQLMIETIRDYPVVYYDDVAILRY